MRAAVMRVGLQLEQALIPHFVDDALNTLTVESHVARQPRHGLRPLGQRNGAQHLPARAGELETGDQPVAGQQQPAVEPEYRKDQPGQGLSGWRMWLASHWQ